MGRLRLEQPVEIQIVVDIGLLRIVRQVIVNEAADIGAVDQYPNPLHSYRVRMPTRTRDLIKSSRTGPSRTLAHPHPAVGQRALSETSSKNARKPHASQPFQPGRRNLAASAAEARAVWARNAVFNSIAGL